MQVPGQKSFGVATTFDNSFGTVESILLLAGVGVLAYVGFAYLKPKLHKKIMNRWFK